MFKSAVRVIKWFVLFIFIGIFLAHTEFLFESTAWPAALMATIAWLAFLFVVFKDLFKEER